MNLERWNPFRDIETFLKSGGGDFWGNEPLAAQDWRPLVDIRENSTNFEIKIDVPAVNAKDIHIDVKDRVLTVSGERKEQSEQKDERVHRVERMYGRFARSFVLPANANPERIDAEAKDGVLVIRIGKREDAPAKAIQVRAH